MKSGAFIVIVLLFAFAGFSATKWGGTGYADNKWNDIGNGVLDDLHSVEVGSPTDNYVLTYDSATETWTAEAAAGGGGSYEYIKISDQKANNVNGGTFTSGSWQTRVLNSIEVDTGSNATLASNLITLEAGTYIFFAEAPALRVGSHVAALRNLTDGTTIEVGRAGYSITTSYASPDISTISGRFTIASAKQLTIVHRCTNTWNNYGFGFNVSSILGAPGVFTVIEFWKK